MRLIIFSDLDGTLLDHKTYSFKDAEPGLKLIKKKNIRGKNIALVLCTSKTAEETKYYLGKIGMKEPFIVENGGAIYIPKDYFSIEFKYQREEDGYLIIELGTRYYRLRRALKNIREQLRDSIIIGFGDMKLDELVKDTKLPPYEAERAKRRGYDEPFKFKGDEQRLKELVRQNQLRIVKGGRYYHLIGNNDKGEAVKILTSLFKKQFKREIRSIAIGDSKADLPMLDAVNAGYLVMRGDGSYASENYLKAHGIGPKGWVWVIKKEVS